MMWGPPGACWSEELCRMTGVDMAHLPELLDYARSVPLRPGFYEDFYSVAAAIKSSR